MKVEHTMDLTWGVAPGVIFSKFHHLLAEGKIAATRCNTCSQVYLPPRPVCGDCYEPLSEWVHVADTGVIEAFTVSHYPILDPVTGKTRPTPYASLLIKLDGASTSLNHYLVESDPMETAIGRRVRAVWREPRRSLKDLVGFTFTDEEPDGSYPRPLDGLDGVPAESERIGVHLKIPFSYAAGKAGSLFLNGLQRGEILASRCPACACTLVPCRSYCAPCFRPLAGNDLRKVGPEGVLVARAGADPRALGLVRLDGADNLFLHRVAPVPHGSRVAARFKPPGERVGQLLDIEYFEPAEDRA